MEFVRLPIFVCAMKALNWRTVVYLCEWNIFKKFEPCESFHYNFFLTIFYIFAQFPHSDAMKSVRVALFTIRKMAIVFLIATVAA